MRRVLITVFASLIALVLLAASAASAVALDPFVTVGQVATTPFGNCAGNADMLQHAVSSGASYTIPETGTISSWRTSAGTSAGQMYTLKIYREVSDLTYTVVAHDGPRALVLGHGNSGPFPTSIPVEPGDVLGLHTDTSGSDCVQAAGTGDVRLFRLVSDLGDGASDVFATATNSRLNISAQLDPTDTFTIVAVQYNKKKGSAILTVNVPNPGTVIVAGGGVQTGPDGRTLRKTTDAPGDVKVTIRAMGKQKRRLERTGRVTINTKVRFRPTGVGLSSLNQPLKLKLKKNL